MGIFYLSGYTENRLNNLSVAEVIKAGWTIGRRPECELGHGRPIEHGQLLFSSKLRLFRFGVFSLAKVNISMTLTRSMTQKNLSSRHTAPKYSPKSHNAVPKTKPQSCNADMQYSSLDVMPS